MSGLTENNLVSENSGRVNSNTPTFVVLKVPFEVRHFCGAILSFHGMFLLLSRCTKSRSPSDPLSRSTRHKSFDFLAFLCLGIATIVADIPSPLTTCFCSLFEYFSTNFIGLVLIGNSKFRFR